MREQLRGGRDGGRESYNRALITELVNPHTSITWYLRVCLSPILEHLDFNNMKGNGKLKQGKLRNRGQIAIHLSACFLKEKKK